jgi:hypothetical protein
VTGADAIAKWLSGRAQAAGSGHGRGEPGTAGTVNGGVRVAFGFTLTGNGRIAAVDLIAEATALATLYIGLGTAGAE